MKQIVLIAALAVAAGAHAQGTPPPAGAGVVMSGMHKAELAKVTAAGEAVVAGDGTPVRGPLGHLVEVAAHASISLS